MAKTKTYRTLFVEIGDNTYRFPYSSDEKADAAFDNLVAKAKEVLGDRITTFSDHSWDYQRADGKTNYVKDLFMIVDESTHIDVSVQDYDWDVVTVPLDKDAYVKEVEE